MVELETQQLAVAKLGARRRRISVLRQRVAGGAAAVFVATVGFLTYGDVMGAGVGTQTSASAQTAAQAVSAPVRPAQDGLEEEEGGSITTTPVTTAPVQPSAPMVTQQS